MDLILKNAINKTFNSIELQKKFHIKNIGLMTNPYDAKEYVEMMKEDYMVSIFLRNSLVLKEYNKRFSNNILTENKYEAKIEVSDFFDFIKKSFLFESGLYDYRYYNQNINEQIGDYLGDLWNKGKNVVKKGVNKVVNTGKKIVKKGVEVVKKGVEVVSPYIKKVLDSQFAYFIPGLNVIKLGKDAKKVYDNWEKIKKMTLQDWVETFRNFLNGATGIAIQIVLALTGVGNLANLIAWGLLTAYDIGYQGFAKGNWNWYNILTDCVGLLGSGAAAAIFKGFKGVLGTIKTIDAFVPGLAKAAKTTPSITKTLVPWLNKIASGGATIISKIGQAFKWIATKIPLIGKLIKPLQNALNSIKTFFSNIGQGIQKYFKGSLTQNMKVAKGAHFDTVHIGKKLTALGDKTLTKKVIGKVTKILYKVLSGDTLQKILSKYAKAGVTADVVKQLNTGVNLSKLTPGTELRLA